LVYIIKVLFKLGPMAHATLVWMKIKKLVKQYWFASYIPIDSHACKLNGLNVHWKQLFSGLLEIPLAISYALETMIGTHFYYSNYFLLFLELQSIDLFYHLNLNQDAKERTSTTMFPLAIKTWAIVEFNCASVAFGSLMPNV
jgi:hypothetical protein